MVAKPLATGSVVRLLNEVLTAVDLNDKPLLQADEVDDIGPNGTLPAESVPGKALASKRLPETEFGVCGIAAKLSSLLGCDGRPPPSPSPADGRGDRNHFERAAISASSSTRRRLRTAS